MAQVKAEQIELGYIPADVASEEFYTGIYEGIQAVGMFATEAAIPLKGLATGFKWLARVTGAGRAAKPLISLARSLKGHLPANMTNSMKGIFGEVAAERALLRSGYQFRNAKVGSNNGIDDVFIKYGDNGQIEHLILNESKFSSTGKAGLANTVNMGKQMSNEWIEANLLKMTNSPDNSIADLASIITRLNRTDPSKISLKMNVLDANGINRWKTLSNNGF